MIAEICEAPIAVVNLIDEDRQWFKAEVGLGVRETPLQTSICAHVILLPGLTVIPDTLDDARLKDNPLCLDEPNLRFYAGMCLETDDGLPIGTLCVLDTKPRELSELQRQALTVMGRQVMRQIQLAKALKLSELQRNEIDHRVKNSLSIVSSLLSMQAQQVKDSDAADALLKARSQVAAIGQVHDQLQHATEPGNLEIKPFFDRLRSALMGTATTDIVIEVAVPDATIDTKNAVHLGVIVNELVTNSVKYGGANAPLHIKIIGRKSADRLELEVSDNGPGLPDDFDPEQRSGLGMQVCRALAQSLGGQLSWRQAITGACFQFSVPMKY